MKIKKSIIILLILVIVIAGYLSIKRLPKELNPSDVKEISIISQPMGESTLILTAKENEIEISEIITRFNKYKLHDDQKSGTTHPIHVEVSFNDDSNLAFLVGVGDFNTVM